MESSGRISENIFSNGDVYYGNFKGTLPQGKGKYTWSDGKIYEGDWVEGKMTGKGKVLWPSGASYEGDFSGGYLHGFGILTSSDGSVYRGSWKLNIQHGFGEKQYQNSDVYEGTWKEGKQEGSGKYVWSDGNIYIGTWKAGNMCGRGVMKWLTGDLFDGFWLNGLRHGSGFYRFQDGSYYYGIWTKGIKDGWGKFYPEGSNRPSLAKWSNSELLNENVEGLVPLSSSTISEHKVIKPSFKRSVSIISLNGLSKGITRRPHKSVVLKGNQNPSHSVTDGILEEEVQKEVQHSGSQVYEREYMQGVLIKERIINYTGRSNSFKHRGKTREARKKSLVSTYAGLKSYYLMLNLQLGIRYTVGKISPLPMREVRSSDYGAQARIQMYFPTKGSQKTPPHCSLNFYWTDYYPMVFRNLREMFKLDSADYMMSICGDDGLTELSSAGKSGSLFYLSHDDRFVIKTLKKSELKVLLKMLPSYYDNVKAHENTLLTKFFGVHQIEWKAGRKIRFVVMGNMFCTELRIHRRYDLKGSYQGRVTNKEDIKENTTFKDLDLPYIFHMDKLLRESLLEQITHDCTFLESQQIIDYSLLLGLHFRAPEHLKAFLETAESMHQPEHTFASDGAISQDEMLIPPTGLLLVTHEPNFVSTAPGPHIRGNTLKAFSVGEKEVDLLLPGTARLRVQLGVNMPAKANHKLQRDGGDASEAELFEVYDVVLYLGIIDILQEYNLKKKVELAYKSFKYDPESISVMEPTPYSKRFVSFLERVFVPT
ncbi:hypothetical protein AgCh_023067 [Apium graveolens]